MLAWYVHTGRELAVDVPPRVDIQPHINQLQPMNPKQSLKIGAACVASVGLCFLYAFTRDQLPDWWRNHGGGVPYVLFWILLWLTAIPHRGAVVYVSLFCVLATCGLELLQHWDGPIWFNDFRRTRFGAAWLGYGYDPKDIPPYFLGGGLGWLVGALILRTCGENRVLAEAEQPEAEQPEAEQQ